ncbi:MAG: hypothetical protein ACTSWR_04220 [Candidatus Helarchaeota archaeon]
MATLSIDELMLELSLDGERKDKNTIEFFSPDGLTSTTLKLYEDFKKVVIQTKLYHSFNQIEGAIFTLAQELYDKYSENTVRDIIEDIATQIKYLLLPKIFNNLDQFQLKESMDYESTFIYQINYKEKNYVELKKEIYSAINKSFELIQNLQEQIGIFIEKNIKKYLDNPEIEVQLLEIKKRLFQVQFYTSMSGRFAEEQRRKAKKIYKEAYDLYQKFKKNFEDEAKKREKFLNFLFDKYKP